MTASPFRFSIAPETGKPSRKTLRSGRSVAGSAKAWIVAGILATSWSAIAQQTILLGGAENFVVLGGSTVTNTGPSVLSGDVGVSPGSAITGFPPGIVVNGTFHAGDAIAAQAHADAAIAHAQLAGEAFNNDLTGQDLGGLTLTPGVYHFNTSAQLTGTLTLDNGGDPNGQFHFQIGSTFTTAANSSIIFGPFGGSGQLVFWEVGSSATVGTGGALLGTLIANSSINLATGASLLDGRALALNGAVTLDTNSLSRPQVAPGSVWSGAAGTLWSGNNWAATVAGGPSSTLAPAADVIFSVTNGAAQNQATQLDVDTQIASLTINDPAAVSISGPGTLTVSGAGIVVNNGAGPATINSNLVLAGQSQLVAVNNAGGLALNGVVAGANGLVKVGNGQLTLTGPNVFSGITALLQGTLVTGAANTIPRASDVLVNGAALLNLNGNSQSIASLGDGPAGGGTVQLGAANLTTGGGNGSTQFSGNVTGPGTLTKVGSGTFQLNGQNTLTGLTTVAAGTLAVNGSLGGDALVSNGTLRGTGLIGGNLVNRAAVNPGTTNVPGTLRVGGSFTQTPSGSLNLRLASPTRFDRLAMGGAAVLGGALNVSYLDGFNAEAGDEFRVLTAGKGVNGRFSSFNDAHANGTILTLGVVYEPNDVLLRFSQGSFADLAADENLSANQRSVGRALDRLARSKPGNALVAELNSLQLSALSGALSLLSAEDLAGIFSSGFSVAQVQSGNIERRLTEARLGGLSDSGLRETDARGAQNFDGKTMVESDGKSGKNFIEPTSGRGDRWGFFISGSGEWGDLESTPQARGSSFTTGGVTVGADYRLTEHLLVGAALGYANTASELSRGGSLEIDSGHGSLYATYYRGGFYVNGVAGAGSSSLDTRRRTLGGFAHGDTDAIDFSGLLGTGYDFHVGAFTLGPIASLQYSTIQVDGFSERGALGAMRIDSQSQDSLRSAVGMRVALTKRIGRVVLTPEVRAQWQHEFLDRSSSINGGFASGNAFTVRGPEIGADAFLLEAGASAQLSSHVAIFAFYVGQLGQENYTVHGVNGGVRVSF